MEKTQGLDKEQDSFGLDSSFFNVYLGERRKFWSDLALERDRYDLLSRYYHERLEELYGFLIPPGMRVLEFGCGYGDLLGAVKPKFGVGVDLSEAMTRVAAERHPDLVFVNSPLEEYDSDEKFDFIILSDVLGELWDVQAGLERCKKFCHSRTRIILNNYSRLWQLPLEVSRKLGWCKPLLEQNWLTFEDMDNLLYLSEFEITAHLREIIFPFKVPFLTSFLNKFCVKFWPFSWLALTNVVVAKPIGKSAEDEPVVSVVVPARNEAGNIRKIMERIPDMGKATEIIFVEGGSQDNTWDTIQNEMKEFSCRDIKLFRQDGKGKGNAVRVGFNQAKGDILMILDADLTVMPEDLPRFYLALLSGKGEFINGVRLVYPMEKKAMRYFNLLGNKFFSLAFSVILGQSIKDTLCGTKVLWRDEYELIAANRSYFGDFDPFGDFDLLFGAAKLHLKILDMPVRYRERTYGETNIDRWRHGWTLLKMVIFSARRIKFI